MSVGRPSADGEHGPQGSHPSVTTAEFKRAVGRFASGVVVLTVRDSEDEELGTSDDVGMTATAFMSVSAHPPMVLVGVGAESYLTEVLERQDRWAVTVLSHGQKHIAGRFAVPGRPSSRILLAGVPHHRGAHTDAMVVDGGVAALECHTHQLVSAGDHTLAIGEVLAVDYVAGDGGHARSASGRADTLDRPDASGPTDAADPTDASGRTGASAALVHYAGSYHRLGA